MGGDTWALLDHFRSGKEGKKFIEKTQLNYDNHGDHDRLKGSLRFMIINIS